MTESALLAACTEGKTEAVGRMLGSTHHRQVVTSPWHHTKASRLDPNTVSAAGLSPLHLAVQVVLTDSHSDNKSSQAWQSPAWQYNLKRIQLVRYFFRFVPKPLKECNLRWSRWGCQGQPKKMHSEWQTLKVQVKYLYWSWMVHAQ